MHELSIAQGIVDAVVAQRAAASDALPDGTLPDGTITAVGVRVGALSGVVPEALHFCFDVVTRGTPLDGASLEIERVAVALWCARCARTVELTDATPFRCPLCETPSADLRRGRELEIAWYAVDDGRPTAPPPPGQEAVA